MHIDLEMWSKDNVGACKSFSTALTYLRGLILVMSECCELLQGIVWGFLAGREERRKILKGSHITWRRQKSGEVNKTWTSDR